MSTGVCVQAAGTVKVFLLAGQSNMQGHGRSELGNGGVVGAIGSLRYQVNNDPANYGHLGDGAGNWNSRDDVWVWNRQGATPQPNSDWTTKGNLTVGFGADATKIGPELGMGHVLGDAFDEPVVLVKTAWGGASLATDFRSPTAVAKRGGTVGEYYNRMLTAYGEALVDIANQYPGQTIELTGFGWHQGWNDRVNQSFNDAYEANLTDFINDIRSDLNAPDLPFVVATTGMSGWTETHPRALSLMAAQLAVGDPNKHPEFAGTVTSIDTRDFYRAESVSPVSQAFHWNQNGETQYLIGESMGQAMVALVPEPGSALLLGAAGLLLGRRRRR